LGIKVVVISISSPILVGIYKKNKLCYTIRKDGKTSDVLPIIFDEILSKFYIDKIIYVNGPGSFMAIKVAYIFLKTLSIVKGIKLKAVEAFEFNDNTPVRALGKKYFFKDEDGKMKMKLLDTNSKIREFKLPEILKDIGTDDILPTYNLPVVN
jgi:hypothetical protein